MYMYCIECGKELAGDDPKFCAKGGHATGHSVELVGKLALNANEQPTRAESVPSVRAPLAERLGLPIKSSDWSEADLRRYRDMRTAIGSVCDGFAFPEDVHRRWVCASDELTRQFPDQPDIGYCLMAGDGAAIPSHRTWPKKFLKKGFPLSTLPGYELRCPRVAVVRWCHVMVAMNATRTGVIPVRIVKYVDTCEGHNMAFPIPSPPTIGRGAILQVGTWQMVSFFHT